MNARVRLPASLGGGVVELSDSEQARLDVWVREARTDDLAGRVGGEKKPGGRFVKVPPEEPFDPAGVPCAVCGLRVGEGRIAWEQSVGRGTGPRAGPDGSTKWYMRHQRAMQRGEPGWEHCDASMAADRAYQTARRERRERESKMAGAPVVGAADAVDAADAGAPRLDGPVGNVAGRAPTRVVRG